MFKEKYLKYKYKYLDLKNHIGGAYYFNKKLLPKKQLPEKQLSEKQLPEKQLPEQKIVEKYWESNKDRVTKEHKNGKIYEYLKDLDKKYIYMKVNDEDKILIDELIDEDFYEEASREADEMKAMMDKEKLNAIGNGIKSMRWLGRKPEERTWDDWHFMSIITSHDGTYQIERFEFDVLQSTWDRNQQIKSFLIVNENETKDKDDQTKYKDYDVLRQELKDVPDKYEKYKKYKDEYELLTKDKATLIAMIKLIEFHNEKDEAEQIAILEKKKLRYRDDVKRQTVFKEYQANVTKATKKYQDVDTLLNDKTILELIDIIKNYKNDKAIAEQQEIAALDNKYKNELDEYKIIKIKDRANGTDDDDYGDDDSGHNYREQLMIREHKKEKKKMEAQNMRKRVRFAKALHEVLTAPKTKDEQLKKARDEENRMSTAVNQAKELTKIMNKGILDKDIDNMFQKAQQVYDETIKSFNSVPLSHEHYAHNAYEKAIKAGMSVEKAVNLGQYVAREEGDDESPTEWMLIYALKRTIETHPKFEYTSYNDFKSKFTKRIPNPNGWTDNEAIAQDYINNPAKYIIHYDYGDIRKVRD